MNIMKIDIRMSERASESVSEKKAIIIFGFPVYGNNLFIWHIAQYRLHKPHREHMSLKRNFCTSIYTQLCDSIAAQMIYSNHNRFAVKSSVRLLLYTDIFYMHV